MFKKKRFLLALVVILITTFVMVGCTRNDNSNNNSSEDPRQAYAGTTLRVLLKTGYETEAITRYVSEFEDATGIKIEYVVYDEPTLRNKFVLDASSQQGTYDVVATQFWYMPEYLQAGWLEPLDDFEADEEWNSLPFIPDGLLNTYKGEDGKLYSVPVSVSGGVLIYRTDLLKKHGLDAPQTTDDVMAIAAVLKEKEADIHPFIARGESSAASFGTSAGWAWAYGARIMDEDLNVTVDTPEMLEAMTDFVTLMKEYAPADQSSIGWDIMSEIFRQGDAAMNFEMSGFPSVYANPEVSTVAGNIGVAIIEGPAGNSAQWMYGEGLGINRFSKNKEAAWLFLQWRSSLGVSLKEVADGIRFDFPDSRVYESEVYAEKGEDIEFFTSILPDILASVDTSYWPPVANFNQVSEAFQREISLAISGRQSVEDALAKAQAEIEKVVEAYR